MTRLILDSVSPEAQQLRAQRMAKHDQLPEGLRQLALEYDDARVIRAANQLGTLDPEQVRRLLAATYGEPLVPRKRKKYKF